MRVHRRVDGVGFGGLTVEDVVGGDMDEKCVVSEAGLSQDHGSGRVDQLGQFGLVLGLVDGSIGCAVDADVDFVCVEAMFNIVVVGDVECINVGKGPTVALVVVGELLQRSAQLSVTSCH